MEEPSESARVQNAVLGCELKNDRMISVRFQGNPFNIMVNQVYALTSHAEEAEAEQFYEDLQDLLELAPKKDVLSLSGTGILAWRIPGTGEPGGLQSMGSHRVGHY